MSDYGMAPTEGRVARPEKRWGCHCGTPSTTVYRGSWEKGMGSLFLWHIGNRTTHCHTNSRTGQWTFHRQTNSWTRQLSNNAVLNFN